MKNWTKYENEIKAIGLDFAATKDGEIKKCEWKNCGDCIFNTGGRCEPHRLKWLFELQAQKGMLIEEMAELMQAVNKFDRNPIEKNLDAIAEEIADVEIMIAQAKHLYAIPQQKIDEITDYKIQRTLERMEVEK